MRRFIAIVTGIGGHLLNGNRKMAYGFFLALLLWPVAFFLTQVGLLLLGFRQAADPIGAAVVFAMGLAGIWTMSAVSALREMRNASNVSPRVSIIGIGEVALAGIATYMIVIAGLVNFVLAPQLKPGESVTLFTWTSKGKSNIKSMPTSPGNFLLTGHVREKGTALANVPLILLFQDGFRTRQLKSDELGRFEYRVPPGKWRFVGPQFPGRESQSFYFVVHPESKVPTIALEVDTGDVTQTLNVEVVFERPLR
jgi:hypothetical protein